MKDFVKKNKGTVVFVTVLVVLVAVYIYFKSRPDTEQVIETPTETPAIGQEILALQDKVRDIRLDDSLFFNKSFQALSDNSLVILNEPTGRINPFADLDPNSIGDVKVARFVDVVIFPEDLENTATTSAVTATTTDQVTATSTTEVTQ
jgi:hypothetical protein